MRVEAAGDLFDEAAGTFYKYVKGEGVHELIHNIYVSNGMAWNLSENKFYYIDSCKFDIKEYDYDPSNGNICKYFFIIFTYKIWKNNLFCQFKQTNVFSLILR